MHHRPPFAQRHSSGTACRNSEKDNGDDDAEEPQPNLFMPSPEPFVQASQGMPSGPTTSPQPGVDAASLPALLAADYQASLHGRVRCHGFATNVHHLDLSGVTMDAAQWRWLSRDILPSMQSVSTLRLARMGLSDRGLAELMHGCRIAHPASDKTRRAGAAASSSASHSVSDGSTSGSLGSDEPRVTLRNLRVLDLSGNHLTHRSATSLGKLLLWAADTLDELHLPGNPLQDYGLQVIGIYLARLHVAALGKERHLFPPGLVRQYAELQQLSKKCHRETRLQRNATNGSSIALASGRMSQKGESTPDSHIEAEIRAIHLGIALLDVRECRASVRGISEVLAGASRAHRLKTVHLARNGVIPLSLISPKVSADRGGAPIAADVMDIEINKGARSPSSSTAVNTSRFSKFEELHYPSALVAVNMCGVPLSKVCSPIGCRELFLNLFFCCPNLQFLDISESFDHRQVSPEMLMLLLLAGRNLANKSQIQWRMQRESEGAVEFTLDEVFIGRQAFVGGILCELLAHAAFNAQMRHQAPPLAFCQLRELYINGTGMTDRAAHGLAVAVRSVAVTGILSSLIVLNVANNLLTVDGCICLLKAFVLDWPSFPSLLSALALQGNAGIERNDFIALNTLRHTCESAVLRRQEEQQRIIEEQQPQQQQQQQRLSLPRPNPLPLPLRIQFGAFAADTMCVASDGPADSVGAHPQQSRAVESDNDAERREEYFPTFCLRSDLNNASCTPLAAGNAAPLFAEVPASASFAPDGSPVSFPSYAAAAAATATETARMATDLSSIHACETPGRLFGSAMATMITPSSLFKQQELRQRSPTSEKGQHAPIATRRGKGTPLISPALEKWPISQTQGTRQMGSQPVVEVSPLSEPVGSPPSAIASLATVTREPEGARGTAVASVWAKNNEVETMTSSTFLTAARTRTTTTTSMMAKPKSPLPQPTQVLSLQKPPQQQIQQQQTTHILPVSANRAPIVPSPSSSPVANSPTPSMAFSIGCLFASMDVKESKKEPSKGTTRTTTVNDKAGMDVKASPVMSSHDQPSVDLRPPVALAKWHPSATNDRSRNLSPKSCIIMEPLEEYHGEDEGGNECAGIQSIKASAWRPPRGSRRSPDGSLGSDMSPLLPEDEEDSRSFVSLFDTNESASGGRRHRYGVTSGAPHRHARRLLGSCFAKLDSRDLLLSVSANVIGNILSSGNQIDMGSLDGDHIHADDNILTGSDMSIDEHSNTCAGKILENEVEDALASLERPDSNEMQQLSLRKPSTCTTMQETQTPKCNTSSRPRCIKTFILTYHHPVGHLLCSGWRILNSKGAEGANARARFEEDVHALVDPPLELQHDGAVLSSVTVMMPRLGNSPTGNGSAGDLVELCDGATRIQFISNERRVVLAERLQKNANVYDERAAFPRFADALDRALDQPFGNIVRVVDSLLRAAETSGVSLPRYYSGKTAATIVHERHGGEDALINELRALLTIRAEETALPRVAQTPERQSKVKSAESNREKISETDRRPSKAKMSTSAERSAKDAKSMSAERTPRDQESTEAQIPVIDKGQLMTESAEGSEKTLMCIESASAVSVVKENDSVELSALIPDQPQPQQPLPQPVADVLRPSGRVRMFVLSLPHPEGHLLCRAWRLLHRHDAIGDEARVLFKEDLRAMLHLPLADSSGEGVEFSCEGASATMKLLVSTSERRAIVSERLRSGCDDASRGFPRLAAMLSSESGKRHDMVHGVQAFLSSPSVLPALRERVGRLYRSAAALVHYYHTDTAALLHELGAASLAAVEDAVDPEDRVGNGHTQGNGDERESSEEKKEEEEEEEEEMREEDEEEKEEELNRVACLPSSPHSRTHLVDSRASTPLLVSSPPRDRTVTLPGPPENLQPGANRAVHGDPHTGQPSDYAFEERMRRLQYLAYNAVRYGAILLDRQQRHKQRICKGKCGRQHVTVAVEWDVFLVIYFVRRSVFGRVARKALVLVHPIAVGAQCFVAVDNQRDVIIHIERAFGPDEVGVSSSEMEQKLFQQLRVSSSAKNSATPRTITTTTTTTSVSRSVTPQLSPMSNFSGERISNTSIDSNASFVTNDSLAIGGLPSALQLMSTTVSLRLTLSSAEKAQETASAVETAGQRATAMIRRTISEHLGQERKEEGGSRSPLQTTHMN